MYRTYRNFPRKSNRGETFDIPPEIPSGIYIADGINDSSRGRWISPSRTATTDDGTLHIGLMNPFAGATQTQVSSGGFPDCAADPANPQCATICNDGSVCDCDAIFAAVNAQREANSEPPFQTTECLFSSDPCGVRCVFTIPGQFGQTSYYMCNGNEGSIPTTYNCSAGGEIPPEQVSTILREIERFLLELDLSPMAAIPSSIINSAVLRLPIKNKSDWM